VRINGDAVSDGVGAPTHREKTKKGGVVVVSVTVR